MSEQPGDDTPVGFKEIGVLKKFDGDYTEEEIDAGEIEPVETVYIDLETGEVIKSVRKEDEK